MISTTAIHCAIKAKTLTPFAYHSLAVQGGTATLPELISDRALAFGLASTLGMMTARAAVPKQDYHSHLKTMPYRCSVLTTPTPQLLPPLTRRTNFDGEGGYDKALDDINRKGNLKNFFHIQEVPPEVCYRGAIFGFDPFDYAQQPRLVIRIGLQRNGLLQLEPDSPSTDKEDSNRGDDHSVRLNAHTAALFQRQLTVERYLLHSLQLTPSMSLSQAAEETHHWLS